MSQDGPSHRPAVALVLTGGGARAAYQVGLLRCVADFAPDYRFAIITGTSAGAINAAFLGSHPGTLAEAANELCELWCGLGVDRVFRAGPLALARNVLRWGVRLLSGGTRFAPEVEGLLDPAPLCELLGARLAGSGGVIDGIARNLEAGELHGVALTTYDYDAGRTTTWVQGCEIEMWERTDRTSVKTRLTVDHVMASAALPILFPAVRIGNSWHGDGGIRLAAPLSPAVHMGAERILTVSTRSRRHSATAGRAAGHPPPAQIVGRLFNAVFLDAIDEDAARLDTINDLLRCCPERDRRGQRRVESVVVRPSARLGALAREYEAELPAAFRFMTRGLGTRETPSPDLLSLLMFQRDYLARMIEAGEADARQRYDEIARLLLE